MARPIDISVDLFQATASGSGADRGVDEQALERMVEVPVVVQVLVVPDDLAPVGVQREGRVVVQVGEVRAAGHELRRRRRRSPPSTWVDLGGHRCPNLASDSGR